MSKQKDQFIALLGELFQLNQPELDFGLYRILHARSAQIKTFIDTELGSEIDAHFAEQSQSNAHDSLEAARVKVAETLGEDAFLPTGELKPEYRGTKVGKEFELAQQQARDGGGVLADDAQVYEHLYRFFSRYYDKGDFMSKRYFVAENDSRAAPYAVPYDGREVMLHWANKDQYYIKSSEALSNFTFDLSTAQAKEQGQQSGFDFQPAQASPLKVHFRLAAAAEGEHNNVKEGQERFFIIHAAEPLKLETNDKGLPELVIQFDYRPDHEKTGQAATWQQKRLAEAEQVIGDQLAKLASATQQLSILLSPAPTSKQPNRTLLGKYLSQFTARNTMDYFIHKNLGGFLRRELDFYIKNEIIRLDDIEAADAPRVDDYLKKLRVLRKIARRIIDFLAQLEDFQKKLWLKKKFVVETNWLISLDRISEELYSDICAEANAAPEDGLLKQWRELFDIRVTQLTPSFLNKNSALVIDTAQLSDELKSRIIASISELEERANGVLVNAHNFHALALLNTRYKKSVKTVYIDPPYNTGAGEFLYRDGYKESSWLSMMANAVEQGHSLLKPEGSLFASIDDNESHRLKLNLEQVFGAENHIADIVWQKRYAPDVRTIISDAHEYVHCFAVEREKFAETRRKLPLTATQTNQFDNSDDDPRGPWKAADFTAQGYRPNQMYEITNPAGQVMTPPAGRCWGVVEEKYKQLLADNRMYFGRDGTGRPAVKRFLNEMDGMVPWTWWSCQDVGHSQDGMKESVSYFGREGAFLTAKPLELIKRVIKISSANGDIIADYFAGSGTTADAVIRLNAEESFNRRFLLVEAGEHFDSKLKTRIQKIGYTSKWREGNPETADGNSLLVKYIRLESFEDTLNNLQLPDTPRLNVSATDSSEMARDYLLKYWLEFETTGSPSLLNVREFSDPTAYKLKVKQPGSDAQVEKTIDLVETFNWLIGLHVAHLDQPRRYAIELVRETDPELPQDQDTRWRATSIKEREDGEFWFRAVEGHVLRVPGDELSRERVLVIWRKLTGNSGRDQAALEAWLGKRGINPRESEFATIYVNGNHALPSDGEAAMRVRLIEETFAQRMWEDA
ncbi:site-specific DNA-methyltransferase [Ectopseudomonas mendocina]|nr:site-specific DNA-methyltransferase [Pseudomonas mendocina]TXR40812.1 site-specific DNA-methyltransferase [Pseudomonas mendocina]